MKVTFTIQTMNGPMEVTGERLTDTIVAYREFALMDSKQPAPPVEEWWVLTHEPTGLGLLYARTLRDARYAAEQLSELDFDRILTIPFEQRWTPEVKRIMRELMRSDDIAPLISPIGPVVDWEKTP